MVAADFDSIDQFLGEEWARRGIDEAWRNSIKESDMPGDTSTEPALRLGFGIQSQSCQMYWMDREEFASCPKSIFQPVVSIYSSAPAAREPAMQSPEQRALRAREDSWAYRVMFGLDHSPPIPSEVIAAAERMIKDIAALSAFPGEFVLPSDPPPL